MGIIFSILAFRKHVVRFIIKKKKSKLKRDKLREEEI